MYSKSYTKHDNKKGSSKTIFIKIIFELFILVFMSQALFILVFMSQALFILVFMSQTHSPTRFLDIYDCIKSLFYFSFICDCAVFIENRETRDVFVWRRNNETSDISCHKGCNKSNNRYIKWGTCTANTL